MEWKLNIRYANDHEKLYDYDNDECEWNHMTKDEKFADVKVELTKLLPTTNKA